MSMELPGKFPKEASGGWAKGWPFCGCMGSICTEPSACICSDWPCAWACACWSACTWACACCSKERFTDRLSMPSGWRPPPDTIETDEAWEGVSSTGESHADGAAFTIRTTPPLLLDRAVWAPEEVTPPNVCRRLAEQTSTGTSRTPPVDLRPTRDMGSLLPRAEAGTTSTGTSMGVPPPCAGPVCPPTGSSAAAFCFAEEGIREGPEPLLMGPATLPERLPELAAAPGSWPRLPSESTIGSAFAGTAEEAADAMCSAGDVGACVGTEFVRGSLVGGQSSGLAEWMRVSRGKLACRYSSPSALIRLVFGPAPPHSAMSP
mmetsp:Transcript_66268/g.197173  ORF Transcript_66268/g.197173 Transcript_66268/m.197173 type:complete len:319 (+) Transcript_66268:327-1283(+)